MQERVPHTFGVTYPRPDGSVKHYQVHAYPTPEGLSALVSDVTDHKHAENALAENKRLMQLVLDAADVATWMWNFDTDEVLDLGNTAKLFGAEKLKTFADVTALLHPGDRGINSDAVLQAKETGSYLCEFRIFKDGVIRWLRGTGTVSETIEEIPLIWLE